MRVIVLTSSLGHSGGFRQALYMAEGLAGEGLAVSFVCPPGADTGRLTEETTVSRHDLPATWLGAERALRALMPEGEPVIVHGFHNRGVKLAAYLGTYWRLLGLPVACVAHRGVTFRPRNPLPYLLPGIRAFLVNSQACADTLPLLWRRARCRVVSNAIPEDRITPVRSARDMRVGLGIPEDCRVIGNISNDNPQKGAGQALRAFALARSGLGPAVCVIVGVSAERWRPLCEELGIAGNVRLVPAVEHVADYLQLMDMLVFPSRFSESQPNVIMEAMSMGVPVIAGKVGGVGELLPEECLFDPRRPEEIGAALIRLMGDPAALRRMGEANAARKGEFSASHRLDCVLRCYQRILEELPRSRSVMRRATP